MSFGKTISKRHKAQANLLKILNQELRAATQYSKHKKHRDVNLIYRIMDVQAERFKLLLAVENERYLKLSFKKRQKITKKHFFKKSYRIYRSLKKLGDQAIVRFRRDRNIYKIFYTLGEMANEYSDDAAVKHYLGKGLKITPKSSFRYLKAKDILALVYFNKRDFKSAMSFYSDLLELKGRKGWPKVANNYAFCLLNANKKRKALEIMKSLVLLDYSKYDLNFKQQALEQIHVFYLENFMIEQGALFLLKHHPSNLGRFYKLAISKGFSKQVLSSAKTIFNSGESIPSLVDAAIYLLDILIEQDDSRAYLFFTKKLSQQQLSKKQRSKLVVKLNNFLSLLRKRIVKKKYNAKNKYLNRALGAGIKTLTILSKLEPKNINAYQYIKAEIYFYVGKYNNAFNLYRQMYKTAKNKRNKVEKKQALVSLLTTLKWMSRPTNTQKVFVYKSYISNYPKDKTAILLYEKLFNLYFTTNKLGHSVQVVKKYSSAYPQKKAAQKAMFAKVLNHYIKFAQFSKVTSILTKYRGKSFAPSKQENTDIYNKIYSVSFETIRQLASKGEVEKAKDEYLKLLKRKGLPRTMRNDIYFNLMALLLKDNNFSAAVLWANKWLEATHSTVIVQKFSSFQSVVGQLLLAGNFSTAAKFSNTIAKRLCNESFASKEQFFYQTWQTVDAESSVKGRKFRAYMKTCRISDLIVKKTIYESFDSYPKANPIGLYNQFIHALHVKDIKKRMSRIFYYHYLKTRDEKIINFVLAKRSSFTPRVLLAFDNINNFKTLKLQFSKTSLEKLSFPEEKFSQLIEANFAILDKLEKSLYLLGKANSYIVASTLLLYQNKLQLFIDAIKSFAPADKPKEYVLAFRKNMTSLLDTLEQKSIIYGRKIYQAKHQINRDFEFNYFHQLQRENNWLQYKTSVKGIFETIN